MAKGFSANWNKFYSAFSEALLDCGHQFTKQGETMLLNECEAHLQRLNEAWLNDRAYYRRSIRNPFNGKQVVSDLVGSNLHPWFTGTLHDSISASVAEGNRTIGVRYMPRAASGAQFATSAEAGRDYSTIVGSSFGALTAGRATRVPEGAVSARLLIGVPYAQFVNEMEEHEGFINTLQSEFISDIRDVFAEQKIRNLIIRPKKK